MPLPGTRVPYMGICEDFQDAMIVERIRKRKELLAEQMIVYIRARQGLP
jgi:SAM-dependent MidA family methyltransferase